MSSYPEYGTDYYDNPITNRDYSKTTGDFDLNKFIADLNDTITDSNPLQQPSIISQSKSPPFLYEGENVITETFVMQSLSINPLQGMDTPQYFSEAGYLISFLVACNDPLFALKVYIKGVDNTGYAVADYSMQKMAVLGLGMTQGEAEEVIFTEEGQSSRDISGTPSTERPYLQRYKHLPTGTETDYEKYKGTFDDVWIVAAYNPKLYPKFTSLYFDVYNGNPQGSRMIHYLEIKRLIISPDISSSSPPDLTKTIMSVNPDNIIPAIQQYQKKSVLKKVDTPLFANKPTSTSMYSVDINQQQNQKDLYGTVLDSNEKLFNEYMRGRLQKVSRLR